MTGWNADDAVAHRERLAESDASMLSVLSAAQVSCNVLAPQLAVLRGGCAGLTGRGGHAGSKCLIWLSGVSSSGVFVGASVMIRDKSDFDARWRAPPLQNSKTFSDRATVQCHDGINLS